MHPPILNYIDGKLVPAQSGRTIDVFNPAEGSVYTTAPDSDTADVEAAITAASAAFPAWASTTTELRSQILIKLADLIDHHFERLAKAESLDNGKPIWLARQVDIPRASSNIRFFATAILHFASESHSMENTAINYTLRQPIGIVGAISPWNLPLYLFTWKIAPALAAGNCVIAKPSEVTPYTAYSLSKLCKEAGLPDGVLNIVTGPGRTMGTALVKHEITKMVTMTGSTPAGQAIFKAASSKRVSSS